jgi:hypothetical protein
MSLQIAMRRTCAQACPKVQYGVQGYIVRKGSHMRISLANILWGLVFGVAIVLYTCGGIVDARL